MGTVLIVLGAVAFLFAIPFFVSCCACLKDVETRENLRVMLQEDGLEVPDEELFLMIKRTSVITTIVLILSLGAVCAGIILVI